MIAKSGCMECGAPVVFEEFSPMASCPSCGTAHRLPRDNSGAWILTYASELQQEDAEERALEIVGPRLGKSKRTKLEIVEIFPVHLPVWKIVARATGWFRTTKGDILPVSLRKEIRIPAYENHATIGVPHDINGSDARICPDLQFPMLHVKTDYGGVKTLTDEMMIGEVSSLGDMVDTAREVSVDMEDAILALYPAWIVRFRTKNGEHSLTIDGITGQSMNVVDIPVTDEKLFSEVGLAAGCGALLSAGVAMSFMFGIHGQEIGLAVAGGALFTIVNALRYALRSSKLSPRPKARKVSA